MGVVVTGRDAEGILRRPLAIQTLTGGGSTWEAVIPDLPMGPQLAFEVTAYGSPPEESELFRGAAGTVVANRWGRVTVTTRYNAPSSAGALVHRIRVRDSEGTVVETDFSIIVAYADTDADVSAAFSPSITSLSASRDGNTVMWEARAADDGPQVEGTATVLHTKYQGRCSSCGTRNMQR